MNKVKKKVAVVMFNLGGPDSKEAIAPFLMNFFMDRNIIRLPLVLRWLLAKFISVRRSKREAGESYAVLRNQSPLLKNSQAQAVALENDLNDQNGLEFKTFICMRYWHPMSGQVVQDVRDWAPDNIIILSLYPQFSTTTTGSSLQDWHQSMVAAGYKCPISVVRCYPVNEGFVRASVDNIQTQIERAKKDGHSKIRVLFSAHGLPESVIRDGDPYQSQCEQTAQVIVEKLDIKDWAICYQSKVGRQKWIGPSLDEALERAAADKVAVVIYPHAFTQEHLETLVELDIEYKEMAEILGIEGYYRAATVGEHPAFIAGLKDLVLAHT